MRGAAKSRYDRCNENFLDKIFNGSNMKKNFVLVLNIDTVKNKNIYQFKIMQRFEYKYSIFAYGPDSSSKKYIDYSYDIYSKNIIFRIINVLKKLLINRRSIHHIELYTGSGNFLIIDFLLGKLLGIKICVVERGSPLRDLDTHYKPIGRIIRKFIYRKTDFVWIRELWMKQALTKLGRDNYFFLSNAIEIKQDCSHAPNKETEFIWSNSLQQWRNSNWLVDILCEEPFIKTRAIMLGFLDNNATVYAQQEYVKKKCPGNLELLPFQDPYKYFLQSKFFILPADIVYLNFSLLEAMSYGVVPIISDVAGARDIVEDGVDGIIAEHSKEGLRKAMNKALSLSESEYITLSQRARQKVIDKFSIENWAVELNKFYSEIA